MEFITLGVILGLSSGITPGPLLALVLSESLQHGAAAGMKVAVSPIVSDIPIILVMLFATANLSHMNPLLGILSILGGGLLLFLGTRNFRIRPLPLATSTGTPRPFSKGILVNALNPNPYLFWFTVGAPIASRAMSLRYGWFLAFLGCFYGAFVAVKFTVAILAGRSRRLIGGTVYKYTMWFLGAVLCLLALVFFRNGLTLIF